MRRAFGTFTPTPFNYTWFWGLETTQASMSVPQKQAVVNGGCARVSSVDVGMACLLNIHIRAMGIPARFSIGFPATIAGRSFTQRGLAGFLSTPRKQRRIRPSANIFWHSRGSRGNGALYRDLNAAAELTRDRLQFADQGLQAFRLLIQLPAGAATSLSAEAICATPVACSLLPALTLPLNSLGRVASSVTDRITRAA